MSKIQLIATAAFGLESVVARELKELGYEDQSVENGRVTFAGDLSAICRTNLWLRSADRVLVKMGSFPATTFDELFEQTKALPWGDWLTEAATFPVEGKSINSTLHSVPDCQAIVKKAVVEKMKQRYQKSWFEESGPRYTIEVSLLKDVATLTIDTSGAGLHKRGYRKLVSQAPLKETMAAALIQISHWFPDRVLLDPFCGSGTIPIEAALIGQNMAPGLHRDFAADSWTVVGAETWRQTRAEAADLARRDTQLRIYGADIDEDVLSLARYHVVKAGVDDVVHLQRLPVAETRSRFKYGYLICNPPFGERLGEQRESEKLYKELREVMKALDTWSCYLLSSHPKFEMVFGRRADKKRKLYNGRIMCNFYQFFGPRPPRLNIDLPQATRPISE
jgi:putative N6-adenine-specific DNA methylase